MIAAAMLLAVAASDPVSGTWEGTSSCQVKPSPCHDEHVVYRIGSTGPRAYRIEAYKIVGGQELYMGPLDLTLNAAGTELDGPVMSGGQSRGRLHMTLRGKHLSGRMMLPDGTLYRLIEVDRH